MKGRTLAIPDVCLIEPQVFGDARGFFFESFNQRRFDEAIGQPISFAQDNHSRSVKNVLSGMHYQIKQPQGKLVRAIRVKIFDVAVDIRKGSPCFGQWVGATISAENRASLWIPPGFAHGFLVLSGFAEVIYKTTDYWAPEHERTIRWADPDIGIDWNHLAESILAKRDAEASCRSNADVFDTL